MKKGFTRRESMKRRERMMVLAGIADFFGTIASFIIILMCVVLLTTLFTWFRNDIQEVFSSILGPLLNALEV